LLLLELALRLLSLPRARSLFAWLFWLLAWAPRLAASGRLMLPPPLERDEEDEDLRAAIDHSFG
jgi:hypothetical protein